jgi:hypothetical protein
MESLKIQGRKPSRERRTGTATRSVYVNPDLLEKLKRLAYWKRITIRDYAETVLTRAIEEYEKVNGELKPIEDEVEIF